MNAKQLERKTKKAKGIVARCQLVDMDPPRWVKILLKIK